MNEITKREWVYKYNDDPEFVKAVGKVIDLARKHLKDMPDNVACPPGCAECCSGYEPFVSQADVAAYCRASSVLSTTTSMRDYVVERPSADGFHVGWLRKVGDDICRSMRVSHGFAQRPPLLRHLRRAAGRLSRLYADRLRRRRRGASAQDDVEDRCRRSRRNTAASETGRRL